MPSFIHANNTHNQTRTQTCDRFLLDLRACVEAVRRKGGRAVRRKGKAAIYQGTWLCMCNIMGISAKQLWSRGYDQCPAPPPAPLTDCVSSHQDTHTLCLCLYLTHTYAAFKKTHTCQSPPPHPLHTTNKTVVDALPDRALTEDFIKQLYGETHRLSPTDHLIMSSSSRSLTSLNEEDEDEEEEGGGEEGRASP